MNSDNEAGAEYMVLRDLDATHARRVRLIVVVSSAILTLLGFCFTLYFVIQTDWRIAAFEFLLMAIGIASAILATRGRVHVAVLLMLFSLFVILCLMALIMDVPTPRAPRAVNLYLVPLAEKRAEITIKGKSGKHNTYMLASAGM